MSDKNNKSKLFEQGFDEGYFSSLKDVLYYIIVFENNSIDSIIKDMKLKKKSFLNHFEMNELDFIKENELSEKALDIWLS